MNRIQKFKVVIGVVGLLLLTVSPSLVGAADSKYIIKFSHPQAPGTPFDVLANKFGEVLAQKTNKQMVVQVFPGAQLGNERDALEGVLLGTVGATLNSPGMMSNTWKPIGILDLPYIFRDWAHVEKVLRGPIGQEMTERMAKESNIRVLSWSDYGFRHLWTVDRAVRSVKDVEGLKMRAPEIPLYMETWRAMGARVVPMPAAEMYTALQQGVVAGQENPIGFTYGINLHEVLKYMIRTYHMAGILGLTFNNKAYQELPPNLRTALSESAWEAAKFNNERLQATEADLLEKMKKRGLQVIDVDTKPFAAMTQKVRDQFATDKGLVQRIMAVE
jgi:tripartite ATP-independent transporter DctP family solute receptor